MLEKLPPPTRASTCSAGSTPAGCGGSRRCRPLVPDDLKKQKIFCWVSDSPRVRHHEEARPDPRAARARPTSSRACSTGLIDALVTAPFAGARVPSTNTDTKNCLALDWGTARRRPRRDQEGVRRRCPRPSRPRSAPRPRRIARASASATGRRWRSRSRRCARTRAWS